MKLTDKNLNELVFIFMISSGSDVYIFYDNSVCEFYATLYCFPRNTLHPNITILRVHEFINKSQLEVENYIKVSIQAFISKSRNKKIDDIIGNQQIP